MSGFKLGMTLGHICGDAGVRVKAPLGSKVELNTMANVEFSVGVRYSGVGVYVGVRVGFVTVWAEAALGVVDGNNDGKLSTCLAGLEQEVQRKAIIKKKKVFLDIAFIYVQAPNGTAAAYLNKTRLREITFSTKWPPPTAPTAQRAVQPVSTFDL